MKSITGITAFLAPWKTLLWMKTENEFNLAGTIIKLHRDFSLDAERILN